MCTQQLAKRRVFDYASNPINTGNTKKNRSLEAKKKLNNHATFVSEVGLLQLGTCKTKWGSVQSTPGQEKESFKRNSGVERNTVCVGLPVGRDARYSQQHLQAPWARTGCCPEGSGAPELSKWEESKADGIPAVWPFWVCGDEFQRENPLCHP